MCVGSVEFQRVMKKYVPWKLDQAPVVVYLWSSRKIIINKADKWKFKLSDIYFLAAR